MAPLFRLRTPSLEELAIPGVSVLIIFLAYTSQYLFHYIEPGPLTKNEAIWFNVFVLGIWWCYDRACTVDAAPRRWVDKATRDIVEEDENGEVILQKGMRWCKKCEAVKPLRAHHCKKCGRCIPKMDHHCPWTTNCVSLTTFPHFIRFVLYAVISMSILEYHLFTRCYFLWGNRALPAYLGPPVWSIAHLLILVAVNSLTLFGLSILLIRAGYSLAINTTMIESWEIERHEALVDRTRRSGGYTYANGGQRMRIEHQEFPYDIGIWKNMCQAMGTSNVVAWFLPFGGAPGIEGAAVWEVNGFENDSKTWPPPDPDKMPRIENRGAEQSILEYATPQEEVAAFRRRQQKDHERWSGKTESNSNNEEFEEEYEEGIDGEAGWTNSDGDRLRDYGVDEEAEVLADDDIPLGELLRRRRKKESVPLS